MLEQFLECFRDAIGLDVGLAGEGHDVQPAELDDFQIGGGRFGQLDRGVGFQAQHVGRPHRATEVDEQPRMGALKLDQARRKPECPESLRDGKS